MLMNKILRYSFMALLAMMVGNVMATEITFLPSEFAAATSSNYSLTKDGVTVAVTSSTVTADQFRIFKSQTITISSTAGNITKAVFTCTAEGDAKYGPGCFSEPTTGSYAYEGAVGTWTGEATEFSMTAATNQVRATSIVVTVSGAPSVIVEVPKFSVASGLYLETQSVAMSCEEGAKILYTIPAGQDPVYVDDENVTGEWYDGTPLEITRTTTIKAMAVKNGKTSSIVTAKYTIVNTTGKGTVESPFSVADALLVVDALDNGQKTADEYVIKGSVTEVTEISLDYGNATFKIADAGSADVLTVFRAKDANGENITDENYVKVGDKVAVQGKLQKYVSGETVTPEVAQGGKILSVESTTETEVTIVGNEDNTSGWWTAFSPYYAIPAQKTLHMEFENYSDMGENWNNFVVVLANNERGTEGYAEYVAVRADNFGWGTGYDENGRESNWDWDNFKTIMNGAKVKLDIIRDGAKASIKAVITGSDNNEYFQNYNNINIGDANANVVAFLTAEKAHLVIDNSATTLTDTTTGINTINADKTENGVRYNLAGQKVNNGFKGVVIMNGKKMLQK